MKKILVAVITMSLFATASFAIVAGGPHDMTSRDAGANTEVCVYCHTPHGANTAVTDAPLWNRSVGGAAAGFYANSTLEATTTASISNVAIDATDAPLCLSCHDGTITEVLFNEPNTAATGVITAPAASAILDLDFSDDHPIGFSYTAAQATDGELVIKATVELALGTNAVSYGGGEDMWCSSCHDVHDNANGQFLRISNAASALCTTCHAK